MQEMIKIRGARVNNLKNIDVDIPINQVTCLKGPSGCGKSSLAFHTIYSESKRRYLNSMPDSFRFFSDRPLKADVDEIHPVLPVFALAQSNPVLGSRSAVIDVMGIGEKLQKLFYHLAKPTCSKHLIPYEQIPFHSQVEIALAKAQIVDSQAIHLLIKKESFENLFPDDFMPSRSFSKDGELRGYEKDDEYYEILRFRWKNREKSSEKIKEFSQLKTGVPLYIYYGKKSLKKIEINNDLACPSCAEVAPSFKLENFSPYNALGACDECSGHGAILVRDDNKIMPNKNLSVKEDGIEVFRFKRLKPWKKHLLKDLGKDIDKPIKKLSKKSLQIIDEYFEEIFEYLDRKKYKKDVRILMRKLQKEELCHVCNGSRVSAVASRSLIQADKSKHFFGEVVVQEVDDLIKTIIQIVNESEISESFIKNNLKSILSSLKVAHSIGLGRLPLNKKTKTLSPGEYQRLLMVKYLSYEGSGSLFIFDEPSLGLSKAEQKKLFSAIRDLQDQGNTILIVEHSDFFHTSSDLVIEMGEGAGHKGGNILWTGKEKKKKRQKLNIDDIKRKPTSWIELENVFYEHYKVKSVKFPVDGLTVVTGDSSSGKSQIMFQAIPELISQKINKVDQDNELFGSSKIQMKEKFNSCIRIDSTIGNVTSRATVGSFLQLSPELRKHFERLHVSKTLGLTKGHFSINSHLGQCHKCEGKGKLTIDMVYLEDIQLECDECKGRGLKPQYAEIFDGRLTAWESFSKPMTEVIPYLKLTPKFKRIWEYVKLLNLDYLSLDRKLNSLSGGERQRINLFNYLTKDLSGELIFFENISFGLSELELEKICHFLRRLLDRGNTIIVIDTHDYFLDIADYHIDFTKI